MSAQAHQIFQDHPITGQISLSTGAAPTPYHVYDGHGTLLTGTCDAQRLLSAFDGQDVFPVLTEAGRGVLLIFICQFNDASHGPHLELHITALCAPHADARLPDAPAAALAALATKPDWGALSLHLWNDSPEVVAYNSEYLGLQAQTCVGAITPTDTAVSFDLRSTKGALISAGQLRRTAKSDGKLMASVLKHLGWRGLWDAVRRKPAMAHVINRKGAVLAYNGRAKTLTAPDTMTLCAFDPAQDQLITDAGPLADYGFTPQIIEHITPFRFVYLHPDHAQG